MTTPKLDLPRIVDRAQWLEERKRFLVREKELTQARDRLNADRRRLPMVRVDEPYVFEGPAGKHSLLDLFEGRMQLMVYHFMWLWKDGEPLERGCHNCSGWADEISPGHLEHLWGHSTTLALISRAPFDRIQPFQARMGWALPWYSSSGSRFNYDYQVSIDERVRPLEYNYRTRAEHEAAGTGYYLDNEQPFDIHGLSCFLRDGDSVYHTYSTYGRGTEHVGGAYYFLDLTALGRQEDWEEPKGRATGLGAKAGTGEVRYPDEGRPEQAVGKTTSCCD